jgi:hypothetical protein
MMRQFHCEMPDKITFDFRIRHDTQSIVALPLSHRRQLCRLLVPFSS